MGASNARIEEGYAGFRDYRSGRGAEADAHLLGHDLRQGRFAETRRAGEQHMIERIAPALGGLDEYLEIGARLLLSREIVERLRPDGRLEGIHLFFRAGEKTIGHALFVAVFGGVVKSRRPLD